MEARDCVPPNAGKTPVVATLVVESDRVKRRLRWLAIFSSIVVAGVLDAGDSDAIDVVAIVVNRVIVRPRVLNVVEWPHHDEVGAILDAGSGAQAVIVKFAGFR